MHDEKRATKIQKRKVEDLKEQCNIENAANVMLEGFLKECAKEALTNNKECTKKDKSITDNKLQSKRFESSLLEDVSMMSEELHNVEVEMLQEEVVELNAQIESLMH